VKRRLATSVAVLVLLAAVLASPAAAAAPAGSGRVDVTVVPRSKVVCTIVDQDHIDLRSNTPWRLTLLSDTGTTVVAGATTRGAVTRLTLPPGTKAWWVELDANRIK
jgi:hypothetical protein